MKTETHFSGCDLYSSLGVFRYSLTENDGYRLVLEVDKDLARYYRSLIPKWVRTNLPMYHPHVTVVRPEKEVPLNLEPWGKYEGEEVEFKYEPIVYSGKVYFWLNVFCSRLESVREELGLPVSSEYTLPPEGFKKCFHISIANTKK